MRRCLSVALAVLAVSGCGGSGGNASTKTAAAPAGRIVATLDAGLRPCALTAAAGSLWITAYADGVLAQVDPATNAVTMHRIGVQPCGITYAGGWLWVARLGTADLARVRPEDGEGHEGHPVRRAGLGRPALGGSGVGL